MTGNQRTLVRLPYDRVSYNGSRDHCTSLLLKQGLLGPTPDLSDPLGGEEAVGTRTRVSVSTLEDLRTTACPGGNLILDAKNEN